MILVLVHGEESGALGKAALEAVEAARLRGGEFVVGLVGGEVGQAGAALGGCGASRTLAVVGPEFAVSRYATDRAAALALIEAVKPSLILATGTSRWMRVLPGVAQVAGAEVDSHITELSGSVSELTAKRWFYRQRMEATFRREARPWMLLLEPGAFSAYKGGGTTMAFESIAAPAVVSRTRVEGFVSPAVDRQTIRPGADLLFVAGAGWTKKQKDGQTHLEDAATLILGVLSKTRASLGSSKSLVDQSGEGQAVLPFLSHLNQVGQTGATPRHPKGLATCCHGEEPHVVGWRFIPERRAVNLDPNCGWAHGKADVLYVADAFEVVAKLNELLKSA